MTRKRFVKLVMSYEIQRNDAEKLAEGIEYWGMYEKVFAHILLCLVGHKWQRAIERKWKALGKFIVNLLNWG